MDAPGVDDEAIAAQLHRELNAFTRRAARGDLPPLKPLRWSSSLDGVRDRKRRRKDGSSPGDSGHPSSSAPTRSPAASSSGEHAERTRSGGEELQEAQGTSQPGGRRGGGGGVGHGASRFAPEPPSWYAALADAAATSAKRRAAAAAQRPLAAQPDADGQQAARQPAGDDPAQKGTPDQGSGSARSIKCFCAGVRWGVSLSADRAKDRSALAAAVREALGGADVKACRDDCHVLMLDSSGAVTSFPAGSAISQGAWDPAAATAVRIYVR